MPSATSLSTIETALRAALSNPATAQQIKDAVGWDPSGASRFLSGQSGITIEKIDALVGSVGYILVTRRYLDSIACLGEVGMHCECARAGHGPCGKPARQDTAIHHFSA
jgi:hypothetical protein